jgi:hypothetical protein
MIPRPWDDRRRLRRQRRGHRGSRSEGLRRFDLKIRFDYLRPEQAWRLFRTVLNEQGARVPAKARWLLRLAYLDKLTPGDFATLVRRYRLAFGPLTATALFDGLSCESAFKSSKERRGIGFTAKL